MNEVLNEANEHKLPVYYTDTDSIHMNLKDVSKLQKAYNKEYNRELIGNYMLQFHTDFDKIKFDNGEKIEPVAVESIFLGKKCYADKLMATNSLGEIKYEIHYRMKGVPQKIIKYTAEKDYNNDIMKLYKTLINDGIEFWLNPEDHLFVFEYVDRTNKTFKEKMKKDATTHNGICTARRKLTKFIKF